MNSQWHTVTNSEAKNSLPINQLIFFWISTSVAEMEIRCQSVLGLGQHQGSTMVQFKPQQRQWLQQRKQENITKKTYEFWISLIFVFMQIGKIRLHMITFSNLLEGGSWSRGCLRTSRRTLIWSCDHFGLHFVWIESFESLNPWTGQVFMQIWLKTCSVCIKIKFYVIALTQRICSGVHGIVCSNGANDSIIFLHLRDIIMMQWRIEQKLKMNAKINAELSKINMDLQLLSKASCLSLTSS